MFVAYVVIAAVFSLALIGSAFGKFTRNPRIVESMTPLGVPPGWYGWLGAAELAGALGLLVGIAVAPLAVAAAIGLILYFVGAVAAHLRVRDVTGLSAPVSMLAFAVVALWLRTASW